MIIAFIVVAALALFTASATGWLVAARRARADRLAHDEQRERSHEAELATSRESLAVLREQLVVAQRAIGDAQSVGNVTDVELRAAQAEVRTVSAAVADANATIAAQKAEIATLRERLAADRDTSRAREGRAVQEVQRVLAPLMERERLSAELARLEVGRGTRGELPRFVDAIAKAGNFSSVVLSDDSGLPLASNTGSSDGEMLAGLWSMLLTVADRISTSGAPVPVAVVVHDAANQTILHRLFSSAGSRFLLTATCRGRTLPPESLDPALDKLERLLSGSHLGLAAS